MVFFQQLESSIPFWLLLFWWYRCSFEAKRYPLLQHWLLFSSSPCFYFQKLCWVVLGEISEYWPCLVPQSFATLQLCHSLVLGDSQSLSQFSSFSMSVSPPTETLVTCIEGLSPTFHKSFKFLPIILPLCASSGYFLLPYILVH